jgi:peptidoglycan/xylan/chitin deacetylase (PgdA/CDA1 family)
MLLTFDDGYRDNFDVAVPILCERDIPATFFIPSAFLEAPKLPWWDHIAYVIKQTGVRRFALERSPGDGIPPLMVDLETMSQSAVIMTIVRAFLDDTIADEGWFLEQLNERAQVDVDRDALGRALFMTWDQARAILASSTGLTVGSHTHSHRKLAKLGSDVQRRELNESKRLLEAHLRREVAALAYPYGWSGTYTAVTKKLAVEAGYQVAFAAGEGVNRPGKLDLFEVRRLSVGLGDVPALLRARVAFHTVFGGSFL